MINLWQEKKKFLIFSILNKSKYCLIFKGAIKKNSLLFARCTNLIKCHYIMVLYNVKILILDFSFVIKCYLNNVLIQLYWKNNYY